MIAIEIPYINDDKNYVDFSRVPVPLLRAIEAARKKYPDVANDNPMASNPKFPLDRLFEQLYDCTIEYNKDNVIVRIVWNRECDYTLFLLKWA